MSKKMKSKQAKLWWCSGEDQFAQDRWDFPTHKKLRFTLFMDHLIL